MSDMAFSKGITDEPASAPGQSFDPAHWLAEAEELGYNYYVELDDDGKPCALTVEFPWSFKEKGWTPPANAHERERANSVQATRHKNKIVSHLIAIDRCRWPDDPRPFRWTDKAAQ